MDVRSYALFKFIFIQVFTKGVDQEQVMLMAARASRTENQDAIDTAIVGMLADPKEVTKVPQRFIPTYTFLSLSLTHSSSWGHLFESGRHGLAFKKFIFSHLTQPTSGQH